MYYLVNWFGTVKYACNQIQQGKKSRLNLSPGQIERVEDTSFELKLADQGNVFEQSCRGLEGFKRKFGHCIVPSLRILRWDSGTVRPDMPTMKCNNASNLYYNLKIDQSAYITLIIYGDPFKN